MIAEEQRLQKEKVRVFELARELDMESKDLMVLCRRHGIELKNQLSNVSPELALPQALVDTGKRRCPALRRAGGGTCVAQGCHWCPL